MLKIVGIELTDDGKVAKIKATGKQFTGLYDAGTIYTNQLYLYVPRDRAGDFHIGQEVAVTMIGGKDSVTPIGIPLGVMPDVEDGRG